MEEKTEKVYTNEEVVAELKSQIKPYLQIEPPMGQSIFSTTCRNIINGDAKPKTIKAFFDRFGYVGTFNDFKKVSC